MRISFQPACTTFERHSNQTLSWQFCDSSNCVMEFPQMNSIIYLVGLVVVVLAILSFFGLR